MGRELFFREVGSGDGAWQGPCWFDIIGPTTATSGGSGSGASGGSAGVSRVGGGRDGNGDASFGGAAGLTLRRRPKQVSGAACAYGDAWGAPEPWGSLSG